MKEEDYTSVYMQGYYNGKDKAFKQNEQERQEYRELLDKHKQLETNWNELKGTIKRRIKSYEDREKLGKGYELTEVMQITLACDRRFLETMQEIESRK